MIAVSKGYVKLFTKNRFFLLIFCFCFAEVADVSELDKEETTSVLSDSGLSMTLTYKFVNVVMALLGQSRFLGF